MANNNRRTFEKVAEANNIKQFQLVLGKNPNNVIALNIGGFTFDRLSLYTRCEIELLMEDIACNGATEAYKNFMDARNASSASKQKVFSGHGRSRNEVKTHELEQEMTYADRFFNIQFAGQSLPHVLWQYTIYNGNECMGLAKSYKGFHKNCTVEDIRNNFIIVNEKMYAINNMIEVINKWLSVNNKGLEEADKIKVLRIFENSCAKGLDVAGV